MMPITTSIASATQAVALRPERVGIDVRRFAVAAVGRGRSYGMLASLGHHALLALGGLSLEVLLGGVFSAIGECRPYCLRRLLAGDGGARKLGDHSCAPRPRLVDPGQRRVGGGANLGLAVATLPPISASAAFTLCSVSRAEASLAACVTLSASARLASSWAR
jgi:hypothetical protein